VVLPAPSTRLYADEVAPRTTEASMSLTTWSSRVKRGVLEPGLGEGTCLPSNLLSRAWPLCWPGRGRARLLFPSRRAGPVLSLQQRAPGSPGARKEPVPGHLVEGGEASARIPFSASPTPYSVDQRSAHGPRPWVSREDAHLLDVSRTVDHVDNDEADHARARTPWRPIRASGRVRLEHGGGGVRHGQWRQDRFP